MCPLEATDNLLTFAQGVGKRTQMVLEPFARWCCYMGDIRVVSCRRKRQASLEECRSEALTVLDSRMARAAFAHFIPISVESEARKQIIFDFFDLLAAVAAHGKTNGLGGRKLSRYAGWWAFEHYDTGKGFDIGYKSWST